MPNISEMIPSRFLKQSDVPDPIYVTIREVTQMNLAFKDADPDWQWVCHLDQFDKPMVLKPTNMKIAAAVFGSQNTDNWLHKEIVLWADPNVTFGGELVGGLRFKGIEKAPTRKAMPAPKPVTPPEPREPGDDDDLVPF